MAIIGLFVDYVNYIDKTIDIFFVDIATILFGYSMFLNKNELQEQNRRENSDVAFIDTDAKLIEKKDGIYLKLGKNEKKISTEEAEQYRKYMYAKENYTESINDTNTLYGEIALIILLISSFISLFYNIGFWAVPIWGIYALVGVGIIRLIKYVINKKIRKKYYLDIEKPKIVENFEKEFGTVECDFIE